MPIETRTISFGNIEIKEALRAFCAKADRPWPNGGLKTVKFTNDGEIKISLEFESGIPAMNFLEHEVAAALIIYCNKHGIPIARRSTKTLQIGQDTVLLNLSTR